MKLSVAEENCIAVAKNLIHRENGMYILEVYDKTIDGQDYYITYGRFRDLISAIDTAKRIERTKQKLNYR